MQNLDYEKIQKIETSATKKLLNYISTASEFEHILDEIDFFFPGFDTSKNELAFNIWLSMDFITDSGKSFISKFLEEKPELLTKQEKQVLLEREKSNISLFEIREVNGESVKLFDLLKNESHKLKDPEIISMVNKNDLIFGRIGSILGQKTFIGDLNYLPSTTKDLFLKQAFVDFNYIRNSLPKLTMKEYLKDYSLNLYSIYTTCMLEAMNFEEDTTSNLYEELDEFENFLQINTANEIIKKHITILIDFFEYFLADNDLTLYNLDQVDLNLFFKEAIRDGFLSSQEDLHSYISTLKKYTSFLSNINPIYKETYKSVLDISKNRFKYINKFKKVKPVFEIDHDFSSLVSGHLNEEALSILMDLDRFILYIIDSPLKLTKKKNHIKRKNLYEIGNIMETVELPNKKAPNQKDFPILHLLFNLTIRLGILKIENNTLKSTRKSPIYLRLRDEEKYTIFFHYIWNNDFISEVSIEKTEPLVEELKKELIVSLSPFTENINYSIGEIIPSFSKKPDFLFEYYFYLQYLGILKCNLYPNYEVKLTSLGKLIIKYIESKDDKPNSCSVVSLDDFKKNKINL